MIALAHYFDKPLMLNALVMYKPLFTRLFVTLHDSDLNYVIFKCLILELVVCLDIDLLASLILFFFTFVKPIFAIVDDYLSLFIVVISSANDWISNLLFAKLAVYFVLSLLILLFFRLMFLQLDFASCWPVYCTGPRQHVLVSIIHIFYPCFLFLVSGHE